MKYLLTTLLLSGFAAAADVVPAKACGAVDPLVGNLIAAPTCLLVHVKADSRVTAKILVTVTFLDEEGNHSFRYKVLDYPENWTTIAFPLYPTMLTVEVEEFDESGNSLSWDWVDL